ncbi:ABC transporter permease [Microbacterium kribbense]|uniref:ABC transporter permease n=1 Tax=Microbacterium kribbense TaxID=433645 RepID=A0ABP7GS80_9MICO
MTTSTIDPHPSTQVMSTDALRAASQTRRRLMRNALWGVGSIALGAVLWQGAVWLGVLPARYFPGVPDLVRAWVELFGDETFWMALGNTLLTTFLGLALAAVFAIPLGILIGRSVYLFHSTQFVLEFFRPIPVVALIPLVVLIMGIGVDAKTFLAALAAFFPLVVQTTYGSRSVDPVALDTAATYGFGPFRRLFGVLLPAASPYIMTGVRISAAVCLLVSVATEIIVGSPGLGQSILIAENSNALDVMYALIAMTGFLGIGLNGLVVAVESRTVRWAREGGAS